MTTDNSENDRTRAVPKHSQPTTTGDTSATVITAGTLSDRRAPATRSTSAAPQAHRARPLRQAPPQEPTRPASSP
jgi:hypothetical protein